MPVQKKSGNLLNAPRKYYLLGKTKLISSQPKLPGVVAQHISKPINSNLGGGRPDLSAQYSRLNIGGQSITETDYDSISYPSNNQWPVEDGAYATTSKLV